MNQGPKTKSKGLKTAPHCQESNVTYTKMHWPAKPGKYFYFAMYCDLASATSLIFQTRRHPSGGRDERMHGINRINRFELGFDILYPPHCANDFQPTWISFLESWRPAPPARSSTPLPSSPTVQIRPMAQNMVTARRATPNKKRLQRVFRLLQLSRIQVFTPPLRTRPTPEECDLHCPEFTGGRSATGLVDTSQSSALAPRGEPMTLASRRKHPPPRKAAPR